MARAYLDQLERTRGLSGARIGATREMLRRAESTDAAQKSQALAQFTRVAEQLDRDAGTAQPIDARRMHGLATTLRGLERAAR